MIFDERDLEEENIEEEIKPLKSQMSFDDLMKINQNSNNTEISTEDKNKSAKTKRFFPEFRMTVTKTKFSKF